MIPREEVVDKIDQAVRPIVEEASLELIEVEFRPTGKRWLLRVYIDKDGGVSIDDCAYVSRELSRLLDVEDIIEHPYVLEVSSPGLTRALKKKEDFERYKGKLCKIVTTIPIEGKIDFKGEIREMSGDVIEVKDDGKIYQVPLAAIKRAHLELEL